MSRVLTPKQSEWAERVRAWETSGMSRDDFAEREGVSSKQLAWWRWKLGEMGVATDETAAVELPAFIELTTRMAAPLELVMPTGVVVRVPAGFDDDSLARALTVLAKVRRC